MFTQTKRLAGRLSRIALMGSVALPSAGMLAAGGAGLLAAPVMLAQPAEAAVIIGDRNKIRKKPRRNYRGQVRIDRDLADAETEITVTALVNFTSPDGIAGPASEYTLSPRKTSTLQPRDVTFYDPFTNANNLLSVSVEGGACDGVEAQFEVSPEPNQKTKFTLCESGQGAITGQAWLTNNGRERVTFSVPSDIDAKTSLYGRILIKGEPLEMERTIYTGDVNDIEVGAVAGYTYEQTITVADTSGTILDSQTVRGIVGGDQVDVMGPAMVIIGGRNKIKEKPRRNYKSVSVTRADGGGSDGGAPTGTADITIYVPISITYETPSAQSTAPPIPPIELTQPSRVNLAVTYANGPGAGDILSGGYCGGRFSVPVGGADTDNDGEIDDMSGTPIEGTDLKIRANPRTDDSLRVRIKGDYADFAGCEVEPLFLENGSGDIEDSFVNYIWEGEIETDPRLFDNSEYTRTVTLSDENGEILDLFADQITLDAPTDVAPRASGYAVIGNRNKLRQKPRRNYSARMVSNGGGGTTIWARIEVTYEPATDQGSQRTVPTTTISTPLTSTYIYEVAGNGEGALQPDAWCGLDFAPLTLDEDAPIGDQGIIASMTERGNGNYRIKVKGPGEAFANQCVDSGPLTVNGVEAYDLGVRNVWTADLPEIPTDLPEDQVFFMETTLINAETGEELASYLRSETANDVPREGPQITAVEPPRCKEGDKEGKTIECRFDRGVQAVFDGRVVTEGLPQDAVSETVFEFRGGPGRDDLVGTPLTTNVCHLFTAPTVTFVDPDSVLDMQYLLEITTSDENGEESSYSEVLVTGMDGLSDDYGEQVGGEKFDTFALLSQNDDMETYQVALSLCGTPQIVSDVAVFITPQDGGSEADPEDVALDFVDKVNITDFTLTDVTEDQFVSGSYLYVETRTQAPGGEPQTADVWSCQDTVLTEGGDGYCGTTDHLRPRSGGGVKRIKGSVFPKPTSGAPANN